MWEIPEAMVGFCSLCRSLHAMRLFGDIAQSKLSNVADLRGARFTRGALEKHNLIFS
jgi:hypothetical protein